MSKFNTKSEGIRTVNLAGGTAYKHDPKTELVHSVLTTFLDDKFYESGQDRQKRLQGLVANVPHEFTAKLAVVARREFHLRSVTHFLLGNLARIHRGDDLVKRAVIASAERPDDLIELVSYVGKPVPKQVRRGVRNALLKFDRYQLAKYRAEGKQYTLVDLFNLCHPKTYHATAEQKKAWADLMAGNLRSTDTWESRISAAKSEEHKKSEWEDLVRSGRIGYMALLRNLNNLVKSGVSDETIHAAARRLADPKEVARSRQLPFRFLTAYEAVQGDRLLADAASQAMDHAVGNVPEFAGKTLIAIDSSVSMQPGSRYGAFFKAAVFGAAFAKRNPSADVVSYSENLLRHDISSRMPVVDFVKNLIQQINTGGTMTSLVFLWAADKGLKFDRIIILSDNESWMENCRSNCSGALDHYRNKVGADPYVFCIDIAGYGTKDIESRKVFHVAGWSDRLLDFIGQVEKGDELIRYIENYEL